MTKRIIYDEPDGNVAVVAPAPAFVASFENEQDALAAILIRDVPAAATHVEIVDEADIPTDRTFRDAWRRPGGGLPVVDMASARDIQASRIAAARRLQARDILEREAMGENVTAAKAQLAAMDAGPQIAGAQTPAALHAVWPVGLPRP